MCSIIRLDEKADKVTHSFDQFIQCLECRFHDGGRLIESLRLNQREVRFEEMLVEFFDFRF